MTTEQTPTKTNPKPSTVRELREEAKRRGLKGYSGKTKDELVAMLSGNPNVTTPVVIPVVTHTPIPTVTPAVTLTTTTPVTPAVTLTETPTLPRTREFYAKQTVKVLRDVLKGRGIGGYSKENKEELVKIIVGERPPPTRKAKGHAGMRYENILEQRFDWKPMPKGHEFDFQSKSELKTWISSKSRKIGGELCLADYARNRNKTQGFLLCASSYKGTIETIIDEHFRWCDPEKWAPFFAFSHYDEMFAEWDTITNSHDDDEKSTACQEKYQALWEQESPDGKPRLVKLRFKRDHKTQLRIQCAVPRASVPEFLSHFPPTDPLKW